MAVIELETGFDAELQSLPCELSLLSTDSLVSMPFVREPGELRHIPNDPAAEEIYVLAAADTEMSEIVTTLRGLGKYFTYMREVDGHRVSNDRAYGVAPMDSRVPLFGKVIFVEGEYHPEDMALLMPDQVERIDHHHIFGDRITKDDMRPANWRAASLIQLKQRLIDMGEDVEITDWDMAVAQMDHDCGAGLRGESEASPEAVLEAKIKGIVEQHNVSREDVILATKRFMHAIERAETIQMEGVAVADLRHLDMGERKQKFYTPELLCAQLAAAFVGPAVVRHLVPSGHMKEMVIGWPVEETMRQIALWVNQGDYARTFVQIERGIAIGTISLEKTIAIVQKRQLQSVTADVF